MLVPGNIYRTKIDHFYNIVKSTERVFLNENDSVILVELKNWPEYMYFNCILYSLGSKTQFWLHRTNFSTMKEREWYFTSRFELLEESSKVL